MKRGMRKWLTLACLAATACAPERGGVAPPPEYRVVVARLRSFIEHEMADKQLPALSIALVDDQRTVWAEGFGLAHPEDSIPATAETVYRVGSVSKLFTDLGIMQLVERGDLDLDLPVRTYVPALRASNPFGEATLRQLMSHRSGLIREPPAGSYFDDTQPSLGAMVESLDGTPVIYAPESRTKYSNAGIATVGYVLEKTQGQPFAEYLQQAVLNPLGMSHSSFTQSEAIRGRLATAYMWTYDGRRFKAPTFQLGMAPAGSMYAPVTDLAVFMSAVFAEGMGRSGPVVRSETLARMLAPQFAPAGAAEGYGIGFGIGRLDGRRTIGHGGAIYGFATQLSALPDEKLGVVAVTSLDGANTVVTRIADYALLLMAAAREGESLPAAEVTAPPPAKLTSGLGGRYGTGPATIDIEQTDGEWWAWLRQPGLRVRLRALGDTLVVDDALDYGTRIVPTAAGILLDGDLRPRQPAHRPRAAPARWQGLVGEYGWDHNTLYILERDERLHALIEWFFLYPLEELGPDEFAFPDYGLYHGERLVFRRAASGRAAAVTAASVRFERREVGTEAGATFTITPVRPVPELRAPALAASPPVEAGDFLRRDFVELQSLDSTIEYDIRYATTNNFMQTAFYDRALAFMQRPAAEALVRAHRKLEPVGYGLLIHDAYRPWYVTKMFWEATPADKKIFVADPARGSRHNRGAAVDLTLFDLATGLPVQMVGGYDEFSNRSFPEYPGGTSLQRWHRRVLREAMESEGFTVYEWEWWHFDYGDWPRYPISNLTFDRILADESGF